MMRFVVAFSIFSAPEEVDEGELMKRAIALSLEGEIMEEDNGRQLAKYKPMSSEGNQFQFNILQTL